MKNTILSFGVITKKFIYPVLTSLFLLFYTIADSLLVDLNNKQRDFFECSIMFFGESLALFIFVFQKQCISKEEKLLYYSSQEVNNRLKIPLVICCSCFDLLSEWSTFGTNPSSFIENLTILFFVIAIIVLSKLFLGIRYYRHYSFGIGCFFLDLLLVYFLLIIKILV